MKIGFLSFDHLMEWHGITRLIDEIASGMVQRGHEVVIIAQEGQRSKNVPVSLRDYPHVLLALDFSTRPARAKATQAIADAGLDIVATSIGEKRFAYLPQIFARSGVPFVFGEPGDADLLTYDRSDPYSRFAVLAGADAIQILLPQYLEGYPPVLRARITAIGNPVPEIEPIDTQARKDKDYRTIMFAGRLNEPDKRVSLLLQAFAQLSGEFADWNLKIVGDGPYMEFYRMMASQLGIARRVTFTGSVVDPETHYATADIYCQPSGKAEGFPMVLLEAAAHSLPLVGFASCAASEALIDEEMGIVVTGEDGDSADALAQALRSIMGLTPEQREEMGERAREGFLAKYRKEIIADQWEDLLIRTAEKTRSDNMTRLETIRRDLMARDHTFENDEWKGLEPESAVWTEELLGEAAMEMATREDPTAAPEVSSACEQTESTRLRAEIVTLKRDHELLEKKHAALLGQFQAVAGQRPKPQKKRRK